MKILSINQSNTKFIKPIKKVMPFIAATMLASTALVTSTETKNSTKEDLKTIPTALALASMIPVGIKRKENDVEMISEDFIKTRKGKYLTEDEIQTYKDKWKFLNENNVLNENNKYIAHALCQNPNIDKNTALKSLFSLKHILDSSDIVKKQVRLSSMIINSEKVPNEALPDVLSCAEVKKGIDEYDVERFLKNIDFIYENIKPDRYYNFMRYANIKLQKINPNNYKPEKITDEMVALYESVKRGYQQALIFVDKFLSISCDDEGRFYIDSRNNAKDWQREIFFHLQNGMSVSDIAKKFNTTEDCINALRYYNF